MSLLDGLLDLILDGDEGGTFDYTHDDTFGDLESMATKIALEAAINALLASGQPITAAIHRAAKAQVINELYNSQSRGDVLKDVATVVSLASGDKVLLIRGTAAILADKDLFAGVGGAGVWGAITGTLTSQTDLNTALGLKSPLASPIFTGLVTTPLIKITSGVPGVGKVLTSDADGDGTWETPAAGGTIDAVPTDASTNAVQSNGVFDALVLKLAITNRMFGLDITDEIVPVSAAVASRTFHAPYATTIQQIWITLSTAQASGSTLTIDINKNGATILSTKLTIDNTESSSLTAAVAAVITDAVWAQGDKITIDVDTIGNGTAVGLKMWFRG